jgi:hypothetical protein
MEDIQGTCPDYPGHEARKRLINLPRCRLAAMISRVYADDLTLDLMSVLATVLIGLFVVAWFVAACAFLALAWNLFRIPMSLKPGAAVPLGNPFNAILRPELLSESGLAARRRAGLALLTFVVMLLAGALSGLLAKVLAP